MVISCMTTNLLVHMPNPSLERLRITPNKVATATIGTCLASGHLRSEPVIRAVSYQPHYRNSGNLTRIATTSAKLAIPVETRHARKGVSRTYHNELLRSRTQSQISLAPCRRKRKRAASLVLLILNWPNRRSLARHRSPSL